MIQTCFNTLRSKFFMLFTYLSLTPSSKRPMTFLLFYLIIKPLSFLPLPILYLFSDILYLFLCRLGGYRKKVVYQNLQRSFPNKSEKEIEVIVQKFYHHFCDVLVESLYFLSISEKELKKRFIVQNPEVLESFYQDNQSVILMGGHYNNWEIVALASNLIFAHQAVGIYKSLKNKFFNEKMKASRAKFGLELVTKRELLKVCKRPQTTPIALLVMADQASTNSRKVYWTRFLEQDTSVVIGAERYAKLFNYPVIYTEIHKIKRGYYQAVHQVLETNPKTSPAGNITEKYTRKLEQEIQKAPQYWLWTHRRWKQKRKNEPLYQIYDTKQKKTL